MLLDTIADSSFIDTLAEDQWEVMLTEEGEDVLIMTDYSSLVFDICSITQVVAGILGKIDSVQKGVKGRRYLTEFGKKQIECFGIDSASLVERFSDSKCNPYVLVFEKAMKVLRSSDVYWGIYSYPESFRMDDAIESFSLVSREILGCDEGAELKRTIRSVERNVRKNIVGLSSYVEALFRKNSRLLIVRVDLRYALTGINSKDLSPDVVRADFSSFLKELRKGRFSSGFCGYIWKLEFGAIQGWHYHLIVFLDGACHREDVSISKEIGMLWVGLTDGRGCYFNCNARKEKYKKPALGMVSWNDRDKISNLKLLVGYFAKADLLIRANLANGERTLGKGRMPLEHSGKGRPRGLL